MGSGGRFGSEAALVDEEGALVGVDGLLVEASGFGEVANRVIVRRGLGVVGTEGKDREVKRGLVVV